MASADTDILSTHSSVRAPFDDVDATVICRSSDGVDFHLYKNILAKASPVFAGMFALPSIPEHPSSLQIVTLTEDADTLEILFRLCYPIKRPVIRGLGPLLAALEALRKYEMTDLTSYLEQALHGLLDHGLEPLRAYAIAYLYSLPDLARTSAKLLDGPRPLEPSTMPPEFRVIPASALFAVIDYRRECIRAATAQVDDIKWMLYGDHPKKVPEATPFRGRAYDQSWVWISCNDASHGRETIKVDGNSVVINPWIRTYLADAKKAVETHPRGASVTTISVMTSALKIAPSSCTSCARVAWMDLLLYGELLAQRIDAAVSEARYNSTFLSDCTSWLF
ncbi:hypothetical protein BN946_scf184281.g13 [Trametes cinnabarina]|uniref:BTB domain-containing protein n=1 Tax=Pycnoporus cinnabarinus TaxID=5643 RepID=A0A060SS21_PYCCI|nr:hypothetical protein BN946_scf184281.g13 [Trametes cinnabarina]